MTVFSDALRDILHDTGIRTAATFGAATIYGNFTNNHDVLVNGVETFAPTFEALDTDLTGVTHGSTITINATVYKLIGIQPNGEGSTVLILSKD